MPLQSPSSQVRVHPLDHVPVREGPSQSSARGRKNSGQGLSGPLELIRWIAFVHSSQASLAKGFNA